MEKMYRFTCSKCSHEYTSSEQNVVCTSAGCNEMNQNNGSYEPKD